MCLRSLAAQAAGEVLVVDCSDKDPAAALAKQFPDVRFLHFSRPQSIPQLRWKGFGESMGDVVANLESWMVPGPQWVEALRKAHEEHPSAPAIGGAVEFDPGGGSSAFRWGDFFYEYGRHMSPADDSAADNREVDELTGANSSYKRAALDECEDLLERGAWDSAIHERFKERGGSLWRAGPATVDYRGEPKLSQVIQQRFHYGRWFASERSRQLGFFDRLTRCLASPLVPWILLRRLWRSLRGKPDARYQLARSAGWVVFSYSLWSLGEACGYLCGGGSSEHRIF